MWNFAQVWFQEFPEHKPNDNRISIATESYGGRYGPAFAAYFQEQNEKILNGTWTEQGQTHLLHLDTLLIINGCVDRLVQWPAYPQMATNNTYGIVTYNETRLEGVLDALYNSTGCLAQIEECRNLSLVYDPTNQGFNITVNKVCQAAETFCTAEVRDPYFDSDVNYYDISAPGAASFPPPWYAGWLNQPHVQKGLGVPLNWTQSNSAVSQAFRGIGDYPRPGWKEDLAYLLENNVKVTLVYGDRDYGQFQKCPKCEVSANKNQHAIGIVENSSPLPSLTKTRTTSMMQGTPPWLLMTLTSEARFANMEI